VTADEREIDVTSVAAGGDGVGRSEGLVVFTPRTAPGDRAVVAVTAKGRFARGELRALVAPSPARVEPPCPHYTRDRCGGCQLQHLAYEGQLEAKRGIVHDSIARIAKRTVPEISVRPSEREWRYREKLTLALRRRPTGEWYGGLHPYDAPGRVFPLDDCPITSERVVAAWREILAASGLFPEARELRGAVRALDEGVSFVLEGGRSWPRAREFHDAVPTVAVLWWGAEERRPRLVATRGERRAPGASFAQVNPVVAAALRARVVDRVMSYGPDTVVDAYAGVGDTATLVAERGARVTAIELDREASAWSASRLPPGSRAVAGRVEDTIGAALPADVVIVNPPRAGVDERVTAALAGTRPRPRALVYVSCNPATLARDIARLPGFRIRALEAFDMFPQTAHVETLCELVPEEAA
jgi:23S rRNA (uracil1939-C5)-methyltransferase